MDSDIQQRRAIRAENAKKAAEKAEVLRLKGNEFFKQGDYLSACARYIDAIDIQGPRPVLLSNLAACYNKIPCHEAAEELATRALEYDPRSVKIRYRRVTARIHMSNYESAIKDLEAILIQDPLNTEALDVFDRMRDMADVGYPMEKDDDEWPRHTIEPFDFAEDSDTEDCKHKPQRPPCRFYNRGKCDRGASCRFSHAPDALSVRDELGRNICSRFLMGKCQSDDNKCVYSHSRAHLPADGWWNSPEAVEAVRHLKVFVEEDTEYDDFFLALRAYHKGHGYAARRGRQLLTKLIHQIFATTVAETIFHADDELPAPPTDRFILVVDFDYEGVMEFLHADLFNAMAAKIKVVHVRATSNGRGGDMTVEHLTSPHIAGVLITDEQAIFNPTYSRVSQKLVEYAKNGGTVVLGGKIANELRPNAFDRAIKNMWGVEWKYGSYFRTTFSKNPDNAVVKAHPSLPPSYSMKALHIADVDLRDAVYVQTTDSCLQSHVYPAVNISAISKRDEAPAVFSKVGKGHLGFIGDVNIESGTIELTMAMLGILTPKQTTQAPTAAAGSSTMAVTVNQQDGAGDVSALPPKAIDKYVLVLDLNPPLPGHEGQFNDQIHGLREKIQIKVAKSSKDAIELISTPNVHGVFVADKGIANATNSNVLKALVQYVKDGGLVVFAGSFPCDTKVDKDKVVTVFSAFGLPWTSGSICGSDIYLNGDHATATANPTLPEEYGVSAHKLCSFHFEDMLYSSPSRLESPILRARVGKGHVGYVGDVNPEPESTMIILSMFELLNPPRELVRDEEKFILFVTTFSKDKLGPIADGFISGMEGKVKVIIGLGDLSKPRVVDLLASPDLVGVFVGDTAVLMPENAYFLSQLVAYSKNGGTLVFGWLFPEMVTLTQFRPLFRDNWGLNWDIVKSFDVTVASNPKNTLIKDQVSSKLPKRFYYQGIYVEGISESAAVYRPQKVKSLWNPGENVYMSSVLFTEVEKGKLGFIGSSSLDGECRTILYVMMGIL